MTFVSYAQNYEDVLLWRALKDVEAGFYIDVGAWDPDVDSVTRAFSDAGWHGVNVEPVTKYHTLLVARRPDDINLALAVGREAGSARLFEIERTGLSTLDPAIAAKHETAGFSVRTGEVEIVTLAEICRQYAPPVIHFLKLDCEGAERDVLLGADFTMYRPWIVLVEATRPNSNEPSHEEWDDLLVQAAYRFTWFDGLNRFYVAVEHYDRLGPMLALPPNVFDNFILASAIPTPVAPVPPAGLDLVKPVMLSEPDRIALAQRCRDCDDIPKVADAGVVRDEPDGTRIQVMHNGLKMVADGYCGAWMTDLIGRCHGHHEPQAERLFNAVMAVLPHDATMIDLGANWCYYTAWFLQGSPARRAVALEPDPANRAIGERNLRLNHLSAAFVDGFAGELMLPPAPFATERSGVVSLRCYNVPHVMKMHGIETLDVLHCDTQGAELSILTGARDLFLGGQVRWVFVSTHVHHITGDPLTHARCLRLLRECGAVIEAEHNPYESYSGDGLIVARFGPAPAGWRPVAITVARPGEALFRDLAYDLAEALPAVHAYRELSGKVVFELFESLLFRKPDPPGFTLFSDLLLRNGDARTVLAGFLRSAEFVEKRSRFEAEYFGALPRGRRPRSLPDDSPFACTGLRLELERDTPLGRRGETMVVPNDDVILPTILARGEWNTQHLEFLAERIDPARRYILLDIGANIGLFARQVLLAFDNIADCVCLEPDPSNYEALCFNMTVPRGGAIHTHHLGLGTADGPARLFRDSGNCGNHSLHPDAMRDRTFTETVVQIAAAGPWLEQNLPDAAPILWKSDTQGNEEAIIAATPWSIWHRVDVAIIGLWRIRKDADARAAFLERVADMPNRMLGGAVMSVDDVATYVGGDDWEHDDLLLWR